MFRAFSFSLCLLLGAGALAPALFAAQATNRNSVSSLGVEADLASQAPSLSANGQYLVFSSEASNLVTGDTNGFTDVFLRDVVNGTTVRISVTSLGVEANGASSAPAISADARFIVFTSEADDLVANDTNGVTDVFMHDVQSGTTARISISSGNLEANGASTRPAISADGRYVCFESVADDLVAGDTNAARDVFVRDLLIGATRRVSVDDFGVEGDALSCEPSISDDGRFVAYRSAASNLVPLDTNLKLDIFVHDVMLGTTSLASGGLSGAQSDGDSHHPSISASGRFVAFESEADNLVAGDLNGVSDIFVHDRLSNVTERESVDSAGLEVSLGSHAPELSPGARYVVFTSFADDLVANDTNLTTDVFCRDRLRGATTRASVDSLDAEGNAASSSASISSDCRYVAFASEADNLVASDLNGVSDVFLRDRGALNAVSVDTIVLSAPVFLLSGASARFSWCSAPPSTQWWLLYAPNNVGASFNGHPFGVGPGVKILASGFHGTEGSGFLVTPPLPLALAGKTLYLEVAARLGVDFYESNTVHRVVQ